MILNKKLGTIAFIALTTSGVFANGFSTCVSGANTSSCYVPAGVTSMDISITGGGGGLGGAYFGGGIGGAGGGGARCSLTALPVTPGELLTISVGAQGVSGVNGTVISPAGSPGGFGMLSSVEYGGATYSAAGGIGGEPGSLNGDGQSGAGGLTNGSTCVGGISTAGATGAGGSGSVMLTFSATPASIPTLSEWAMIIMASLMAMFAFRKVRRQ